MKKKGLYSKFELPDSLKEILNEEGFLISDDAAMASELSFSIGEEAQSNIFLNSVDWENVKISPCAFINPDITSWEMPALILKRFFHGEGGVNPADNFSGLIECNYTLKITNEFSLGHVSDQVSLFAAENDLNPVVMRNYLVSILTFIEYLRMSGHAELPVELDFGLSKDAYYLQINCPANDLYIENFLEATKKSSVNNPFVSLIQESLSKTDLLEVYSLSSTKKLVITSCWISNESYTRNEGSSTLLIHQLESFKNGVVVSPSNAVSTELFENDNEANHKLSALAEALPTPFLKMEGKTNKINPVLVRRLVRYIFNANGDDFDYKNFHKEELLKNLNEFYDQAALISILEEEKDEVIRQVRLGGDCEELAEDVELLKNNIDEDDYFESLINSMSTMSFDDAQAIAGKSLQQDEAQHVKGLDEEEEESQLVNGLDDEEEGSQHVKGLDEEEEESQLVKGLDEEEEGGQLVKGLDEEEEESQLVKGLDEEEESKAVIKGNKERISEENWEVRRDRAVEELKGRMEDLRDTGISHIEIDNELKKILMNELEVSEASGTDFVEALSDNATDGFLRGPSRASITALKDSPLEQVEKKLEVRSKQVEKMKEAIVTLNEELAKSRGLSSGVVEPDLESDHSEKSENLKLNLQIESINNEKVKLAKENEILLRKIHESTENINSLNQSLKDGKKENANKAELEKIIADKEFYFNEKVKLEKVVEDRESRMRNMEFKLRELEAKELSSKAKNFESKRLADKALLIEKEKQIVNFRTEVNLLQAESKSHELKAKAAEQKMKFMSAQLEKFRNEGSASTAKAKKTVSSSGNSDVSEKLKQMQQVSAKLKASNDKLTKELLEKKTLAHKATLESKTLAGKVKELEHKISILNKKKAA